jgi:bifunctional DNA-binding transcriptional regulator/antitoxin component of YhaV-PrlF toxin-antitoxin module
MNKQNYLSVVGLDNGKKYENLFILGTAEKGPLYIPIKLKSKEELFEIFGNKGSIIESYNKLEQAFESKINVFNIYFVKISGTYAICDIENKMSIRSISTDKDINNAYIQIAEKNIMFKYPKKNIELVYKIRERDIVDIINEDERNPIVITKYDRDLPFPKEGVYYFTPSESGLTLTKNEHYFALKETLQVLEGLYINNIVFANVFCDDSHPYFKFNDFAEQTDSIIINDNTDILSLQDGPHQARFYKLAQTFCLNQTLSGIATHTIMGFNPNSSKNNITNYAQKVYDALYIEDIKASGHFLSLFVGDLVYPDKTIDNGYLIYAALLSLVEPGQASTNLPLPKTLTYLDNFSEQDLKCFYKNGIVTYRNSMLLGYVIYNGITFSSINNPYFYLEDFKLASYVDYLIKKEFNKKRGESLELLLQSAKLATTIEKLLVNLIDDKISDYTFNFSKFTSKNKQSRLTIYITITNITNTHKIEIGNVIS